jgi:hypothetical protein
MDLEGRQGDEGWDGGRAIKLIMASVLQVKLSLFMNYCHERFFSLPRSNICFGHSNSNLAARPSTKKRQLFGGEKNWRQFYGAKKFRENFAKKNKLFFLFFLCAMAMPSWRRHNLPVPRTKPTSEGSPEL